jgi:hypothetical protein
MKSHPLAIVGNGLAALVAAAERARRGLPTLVVNPGGPWGGYFAGVHADGIRWDAGMVLYEFDSYRMPAVEPALSSYAPQRRNDIGRFCATVRDYIARHQPTHAIAAPSMWVGGRVLPDLLLANRLDALPQLDCAGAARAELASALDQRLASPGHARRKDGWAHGAPDADTASRLNHGHVLHDAVFGPFARQVLNRDAAHLAALYHRVPWLPLYWPETLLAALDDDAVLAPSTFWHPTGASVADLCPSPPTASASRCSWPPRRTKHSRSTAWPGPARHDRRSAPAASPPALPTVRRACRCCWRCCACLARH